jgi:hypothetical protein
MDAVTAIRIVTGIAVMGLFAFVVWLAASHARPRREAGVSSEKPKGIGGWLLLLIVRLWIGTAVRLIGGFAAGFSLIGLFSFGSVALSGAAALLLGFKNAKGVLIAKIFLAADAIYYSLSLIDSLLGSDSQVSSSMPPWFQPSGYLIASVLWLVYLIRSRRVKNTYFPAAMQVNTEDEQMPSKRHGWSEMAEPTTQPNAIHENAPQMNIFLARNDAESTTSSSKYLDPPQHGKTEYASVESVPSVESSPFAQVEVIAVDKTDSDIDNAKVTLDKTDGPGHEKKFALKAAEAAGTIVVLVLITGGISKLLGYGFHPAVAIPTIIGIVIVTFFFNDK